MTNLEIEIYYKNEYKIKFFLKKYKKMWDKASSIIEKGFDSESVHNSKYLKTRIKSYGDEITINFHIKFVKENLSVFACH